MVQVLALWLSQSVSVSVYLRQNVEFSVKYLRDVHLCALMTEDSNTVCSAFLL